MEIGIHTSLLVGASSPMIIAAGELPRTYRNAGPHSYRGHLMKDRHYVCTCHFEVHYDMLYDIYGYI